MSTFTSVSAKVLGALTFACENTTSEEFKNNGAVRVWNDLLTKIREYDNVDEFLSHSPEHIRLMNKMIGYVRNHNDYTSLKDTPDIQRKRGLHLLGTYIQNSLNGRFVKEETRDANVSPRDHMLEWFRKNRYIDPARDSDIVQAGFLAMFYL